MEARKWRWILLVIVPSLHIFYFTYFFLGREDIVARIQADETILARLPCKLDLMNYRQLSEWIRNQIILNHTERGQIGTKIAYGDQEWHPDFWMDEIYPWSSMSVNFNNMKASQYSGPNTFVWFMKETIRNRLSMKGIVDPDTHVSMEFSEEEVARKERRRGLHSRPSVVRRTDEETADDIIEANYNDQSLDLNNSIENATSPANSIADDLQNFATDDFDEIPPPLPPMEAIPPPLPPRPSSPPTRVTSPIPPCTTASSTASPDVVDFRARRKRPSQLFEENPQVQGHGQSDLGQQDQGQQGQRLQDQVRARQLPPRFPRHSVITPPTLPPKRPRRPVICRSCNEADMCHQHSFAPGHQPQTSSSPPAPQPPPVDAHQNLTPLVIAADLVTKFTETSKENTRLKTETGGLLFGQLVDGQYIVDRLVIPKQIGRSDYWKTTHEAEIGEFCETNPSFNLIGTIHTHPGFTARPSSVDLHQQFDIQLQQPSAIGIIVAPERNESPSYTITPYGMTQLRECAAVGETVDGGFHPHRSARRLFAFATHLAFEPRLHVVVIDQR